MKARGLVDGQCVLVCEPSNARPGVETYMERFFRERAEAAAQAEQEAAAATAAPSAGEASTGSGAPAPMEVDCRVEPGQEGWNPINLPPRSGESAYEAASRMQLKSRRHTSYVAMWVDPDSLTSESEHWRQF